MGYCPKKKQNRQPTADGGHQVDLPGSMKVCGGSVQASAKQDNEEPAEENEQGRSRRMGNLQFVCTGNEFPAIPEAYRGLPGQDEYCGRDRTHDPSDNDVGLSKIHANDCEFGLALPGMDFSSRGMSKMRNGEWSCRSPIRC
jgi:hypothetical protein